MSNFYIKILDGHDRPEDYSVALDAATAPDVVASLNYAKALRQHNWNTRRVTSHGEYFGDPNYKWLAHIPGKLAKLFDAQYPGWDSDETVWAEVCRKYPQIHADPRR